MVLGGGGGQVAPGAWTGAGCAWLLGLAVALSVLWHPVAAIAAMANKTTIVFIFSINNAVF
jgi:hypothetical protein